MSSVKLVIRMIVYDIKTGLYHNRVVYIALVLLFFVVALDLNYDVKAYEKYMVSESGEEVTNTSGSITEHMLNFQKGMEILRAEEKKISFEFPVVYLGLAIAFSFMTGNNLTGDGGYTILVRGRSKKAWVFTKLMVNLINIIFVYCMMLVIGVVLGRKEFTINQDICKRFMRIEMCTLDTNDWKLMILVFFIVPVFCHMAISVVQAVVSEKLGNIPGVIVSISIYVLSIYDTGVIAMGNGSMAQRFKWFSDDGIEPMHTLLFGVGIIVLATMLWLNIVKKRDWLNVNVVKS